MIVGSSFVFGASSIQKLTSNESAQEALEKAEDVTNHPRLQAGTKLHSFGIGVGQTFLTGGFDEIGEDKITFDLLYNYSASHSFDLLVDLHHSKHEFRDHYVKLSGLAVGIKAKVYQFDSFAPFALGGLGFYLPKAYRGVNNEMVESDSHLTFGYHFGGGCDLRLNKRMTVGILGTYHNPFDVKQELGPEVEGSYFKLLITTLYTF
jgi:opacity protein-like surface antigen